MSYPCKKGIPAAGSMVMPSQETGRIKAGRAAEGRTVLATLG